MQGMIDTHLHLWDLERHDFTWLKDFPTLNRTLTLHDHATDLAGFDSAGIKIIGSVFVECDVDEQCLERETIWACGLADQSENNIVGVIAGCRPDHPDFGAYLDRIEHRQLKGLRRVLHAQPDELLRSTAFIEGVKRLGRAGLSFDLCVRHNQLPAATDLVRRCPETRFVLDHCGNPPRDPTERIRWRASVTDLSRELNVVACKLSGLFGSVDPGRDLVTQCREIVDDVASAFGLERLMFGSDWPVCRIGGSIQAWINCFNFIIADWPESARQRVLATNASRVYHLDVG